MENILNEELHDLYFLLNTNGMRKSRRKRRAGVVVCMEDRIGVYRVLVGRPE
jgi:hypothetical protein